MATKNLLVRGGADFSGMKKEMMKAQKQMQNFKDSVNNSLKGIGTAIATIGAGLYIKDAVADSMKFEASIQQVNRLMGESSREFMNWANTTAAAFNMSKSEAVQYGATYSNIISTFAKDTSQTQQYTQDLLQATAVAASKTGRSMEDALERVRSGMLGNTEAIEDLGIFVNVSMIESTKAFRQFAGDKSWQQLDFRTQQQIRLFAILEQAAEKYGIEVGNNTVSATAKFSAQLSNLKLAMGQAFMPIWNFVLPTLTSFIAKITQAMNVVAQFTQALFGKEQEKQAKNIQQQSKAVDGLGKSLTSAEKAAKKAKGSLAGFDEINQLNKKDSGGATGDSTGMVSGTMPTATPINFETNAIEVGEKIRAMALSVKAFFVDLKNFLVEHKVIITSVLAGIGAGLLTYGISLKGAGTATLIWGGIVKVATALLTGLKAAFLFLTSPIGIIVGLIAGLTAAFTYFYQTNENFRGFVDEILTQIKEVAVDLWHNVLVPLGEFLSKTFVEAWRSTQNAIKNLWDNILSPLAEYLIGAFSEAWKHIQKAIEWLWNNVLKPLGQFLLWFWDSVLVPIGGILVDVLAIAFSTVADVAKSLWKNVLVPLGEFFANLLGPTVEALSAVFTFLWKNVFSPIAKFLGSTFKGVFDALIKVLTTLWKNVLKPITEFMSGAFKTTFNTVFEGIGGLIKGLQKTFEGLMNFITGVFTGDWKKAWEGAKKIFEGVFDSLYSIVKTPLNLIIDAINSVIRGLNRISVDVPDWVPFYGGEKFGFSIPRLPKLARGGLVDGETNFGNYIAGEAGAELIVPLENTSFTNQIASALGTAVMNAMNTNSNNNGDVVIKVGELELGRIAAKSINKAQRVSGQALLEI